MHNLISKIDINAVRNIDSEAAKILSSAIEVTGRILSRRKAMDSAGDEDKLLYVLAGETHFNPCEYLHHVILLEALKHEAGFKAPTICGVEVEHDYYEKDSFDPVAPKGSEQYLYDSFSYAADCYDGGGAAYGRKVLFTYLAQQKKRQSIVPVFNDASCTPFDELELDDVYTQAALNNASLKGRVIDVTVDEGMLDIATQLAEQKRSNIVIQIAGFHHLGGSLEAPAEQSMSAQLDRMQRQHINIYATQKPRSAYTPMCGEDIICANIPNYEAFKRNALKFVINEDAGQHVRIAEREKEFVDGKLDAMGLSHLKP